MEKISGGEEETGQMLTGLYYGNVIVDTRDNHEAWSSHESDVRWLYRILVPAQFPLGYFFFFFYFDEK